jgi:predicted CoA-binding protein
MTTEKHPSFEQIFSQSQTIAVVGLSAKPERPSHRVAASLQQAGYRIFPVNPGQQEILGQTCWPHLAAIPYPVDIVNIFRKPDQVLPIVAEAVRIGAKVVWMQQGIINQEAAELAQQAGLLVVMDRCIHLEHLRLYKAQEMEADLTETGLCSLDKMRSKR